MMRRPWRTIPSVKRPNARVVAAIRRHVCSSIAHCSSSNAGTPSPTSCHPCIAHAVHSCVVAVVVAASASAVAVTAAREMTSTPAPLPPACTTRSKSHQPPRRGAAGRYRPRLAGGRGRQRPARTDSPLLAAPAPRRRPPCTSAYSSDFVCFNMGFRLRKYTNFTAPHPVRRVALRGVSGFRARQRGGVVGRAGGGVRLAQAQPHRAHGLHQVARVHGQ
jgi:hypothetical protein